MMDGLQVAKGNAAVARVLAIFWEAESRRIALRATDVASSAWASDLRLSDLAVVLERAGARPSPEQP